MTALDFLRKGWEVQRDLYLAQGLNDLVAEADALSLDEHKHQQAPSTFQHEWADIRQRLRDASDRKMEEDGGIAAKPLLDWLEFAKARKEERLAHIGERLRTPRGMMYSGFFLLAQVRLEDWNLASVTSMSPDLTKALGEELDEGLSSKLAEARLRQLAAATARVVENYYKPLLQIIWTLTARMASYTKKMPRMCGQLIQSCRELWPTLSDTILPTDFLDDDAVEVRNGIAHPATTRFDVATQELVFERDDGRESRFTEDELRRRLHAVLFRSTLMDSAFQLVAGVVPSSVLGSKETRTEDANAAVEAPLVQPPETAKPSAPDNEPARPYAQLDIDMELP